MHVNTSRHCSRAIGWLGLLWASFLTQLAVAQHPPSEPQREPTVWFLGVQNSSELNIEALARLRAARKIVEQLVPPAGQEKTCAGPSCSYLLASEPSCQNLQGMLIGAELDWVSESSGQRYTRVRTWKKSLDTRGDDIRFGFGFCPADDKACLINTIARAPEAAQSDPSRFAAEGCSKTPLPELCSLPFSPTPMPSPSSILTPKTLPLALDKGIPTEKKASLWPQRWEWAPAAATGVGLVTAIGLAIANEYVVLPPAADSRIPRGAVLTPAVWTAAGLTLLMGVGTIAVVAGRHQHDQLKSPAKISYARCRWQESPHD